MSDRATKLTIAAARRDLARRFSAAGLDTPELDARLLVGAALGLDLSALVRVATQAVSPDNAARIDVFADRRLAGEPVARILGRKEFWSLPFNLSAATLVPRPDTETVVEAALHMLRERPASLECRIADIGTGTGAILLALLSELPDATGVGTDLSADALETAATNAQRLGVRSRARFVQGSYTGPLDGTYDLIVSNPPYVRTGDIAGLAPEVRDHDPHLALDGGADGLDAYRALVPEAAGLLRPGGLLIVEIGLGQRDDVARLMTEAGLVVDQRQWPDLSGIPRAVAGRNRDR